jgi:hypothetical protein
MSDFDKELFASLLIKAKGKRTLNNYARQSGVTGAHISRLSRALLDSPPTAPTIKKLADHAHNDVTYEKLMSAAGYMDEDPDSTNSENTDDIRPLTPEEQVFFKDWDKLSEEQQEKVKDYIRLLRLEAEQYNNKFEDGEDDNSSSKKS